MNDHRPTSKAILSGMQSRHQPYQLDHHLQHAGHATSSLSKQPGVHEVAGACDICSAAPRCRCVNDCTAGDVLLHAA